MPTSPQSQLETVIDTVFRAVQQRLGADSDPQLMQLVVREVVAAMAHGAPADDITQPREGLGGPGTLERSRAVVTSSGRNAKGQVAGIATAIADQGGDIMDMSQTIVSDYFTLIIVVDITELTRPFSQFKEALAQTAERMGIHVTVMHEDVLRALQRV